MKILFLTLGNFNDIDERGIYTDLVRALADKGEEVYVVSPRQARENLCTELTSYKNIQVLHVKTGNITKTKSFIEKGLSTLRIEGQYLNAIKKYFKNIHFDMVMYSTPPITFNKIIKYFKRKQNTKSYLILKDIFPQNAIDIGLMRENSIIYKFFKRKEKILYKNSDVIGCMSQGNVEYILKNNTGIDSKKVEIFPNAIKPIEWKRRSKNIDLLKKYKLPIDKTIFIYGGNLGKPQGIDFLVDIINHSNDIKMGHLLIIGDGTEFDKINQVISNKHILNVSLYNRLAKNEYDELISSADVGLIFLDNRFTIPNIPSRLTSYMENGLPILAATDKNTDLKDIINESRSGYWCESGNLNEFIQFANQLSENNELRRQLGKNGRKFLEENYDVSKTVDILLKHL